MPPSAKPKAFFIIMKFEIKILDSNFCFAMETVKSENGKKHLIFYNGCRYHKVNIEELEELIECAKNTIENFKNVSQYVLNQNKNIEEERFKSTKNIKPKKNNNGFIYIALCSSTNFYKIGQTKCVDTRIKQLKTANANIELIKHYKVDNVLFEKEIHLMFAEKNVNREWFSLNKKDLKVIDKLLKN